MKILITTDQSRFDIDAIHDALSKTYWAKDIAKEKVIKSLKNSFCFGVFDDKKQIGLARVISDFATFAYLADVYILEDYRGKGLALQLMQNILAHPELQDLRRWLLFTVDAHELYRKVGFEISKTPERVMEIRTSSY